jgi:hypothetical protein
LDYVLGPTGPTGPSNYKADSLLWEAPIPTTTAEAIDRLAAALVGLLGSKIP